MSTRPDNGPILPVELACGVVAGPLFVTSFTMIGGRRAGYDWRRLPVSSLANGPGGRRQQANFVLAGTLYCLAADGLRRGAKRLTGPRAIPALLFGAGAGLVGSGVFVTDAVAGFPPAAPEDAAAGRAAPTTRAGRLHNLCAIPIFAGIPLAALISAASAARAGQRGWACYSAGSAVGMPAAFVLFGVAFGDRSRLAGWGGVMQRISIATGFGWLSALSLRALRSS